LAAHEFGGEVACVLVSFNTELDWLDGPDDLRGVFRPPLPWPGMSLEAKILAYR
jgi:hypothetical protein